MERPDALASTRASAARRNPVRPSQLLFALVIVAACSNVLDISEPRPRPNAGDGSGNAAGEASPPVASAGDGMTVIRGEGGESGAAGETPSVSRTSNGGHTGGGAANGGADALPPVGPHSGDGGGQGFAGFKQTAGSSGGPSTAGSAGVGGATACDASDAPRCNPNSPKTPEVCKGGRWVRNAIENNGLDCAIACTAGHCAACAANEKACDANNVKTCVDGAWTVAPFGCPNLCVEGQCVTPSSCAQGGPLCGLESCCVSLNVPGGTYYRGLDAQHPATVSAFSMDKYEIVVGRLKNFMNWLYSVEGHAPAAGAGKSKSANDPGWKTTYPLPATLSDMQAMLACTDHGMPADSHATYPKVTATLPANCLTFYVAYAMCIWDGGRLPTEAEWNFAAAGGSEQRFFPWSVPPSSTSIDATRAAYRSTASEPLVVGSLPAGFGRYGHADLGGNVAEWTLDYSGSYPDPCTDCMNGTVSPYLDRVTRGGNFLSVPQALQAGSRSSLQSDAASLAVGFRCVHDL